MITLPTAAGATTEYEDFYESTLQAPVGASDTDIYPTTMPASAVGFLVIDPLGTNPEIIYYNIKGANYVRVPSSVDGEGRGVGNTTPRAYDAGTKIGMYSIAEFFEGIATGSFMRDGFLQSRHFSSAIDPNSWIGTGESWNYVGSNGNKEFQYVVAGDKRTKYQKGMKLRMPRITAAPYQTMKMAKASSQYAAKASPSAGINLGTAYTFEALVNLDSVAGLQQTVLNRTDAAGTQGWKFGIGGSGQIYAQYLSAGTNHFWSSYMVVPVGNEVHIAAVVDNTAQTVVFYMNGLPIAGTQTTNAGAHTTANTGDLRSGATSTTVASEFLDGSVSQIRVWNSAKSAAAILAAVNTPLVGNEAGLLFLAKGDGNFNDSTANANNMTSVNGAVANDTTKTPFKAVEFGILTDMSFAAGNTTMSVYTGNRYLAPAENLTGIGYSAAANPYGMDTDKQFWRIVAMYRTDVGVAPSVNVWYGYSQLFVRMKIMRGAWRHGYQLVFGGYRVASTAYDSYFTFGTLDGGESDPELTSWLSLEAASGTLAHRAPVYKNKPISLTTPTDYFANMKTSSGASDIRLYGSNVGVALFFADCAYLGS